VSRVLAVLGVIFALAGTAEARSIRNLYRTAPSLVGLGGLAADERYQNAADVILESAIRNLPLYPAASSTYTYRWNATQGALERIDDSVAPLYTERGQTLGAGLLNVGVTFGYFDVECSGDCRLGTDPLPISTCCGAKIQYQAKTDLVYTVSTFNITYGVTDDLDVNIAIPIATLDMDLDVTRQDTPDSAVRRATAQESSAFLSDMLVRAKYRLFDTTWALGSAVGAAGVRVRIPSGKVTQGLGTGYGEIGPYFALSTALLDGWLDSHWDLGVDAGIGDTRRSSAHYGWALDIHAPRGDEWWTRVALAWEVLGRSEFTSLRQPTSISGRHVAPSGFVQAPYLCADANRHDYVDTTIGLRMNLVESIVLTLGVFHPLNDQGVRAAGWSPIASVEGTF
jgi:Putative MetA-pathway of phenol degradation